MNKRIIVFTLFYFIAGSLATAQGAAASSQKIEIYDKDYKVPVDVIFLAESAQKKLVCLQNTTQYPKFYFMHGTRVLMTWIEFADEIYRTDLGRPAQRLGLKTHIMPKLQSLLDGWEEMVLQIVADETGKTGQQLASEPSSGS